MRFIGILGFISSGFFAFVGLLLFFVPTALVSLSGELAEAGLAFVGGAFAGLIYIGLAALGFLPARFLYRSGAGMRRFARTGSGAELEEALRCNKAFWKFVGIVLIIQLALVPVTIVLVTIVAIGSVM
jgi:hypothetical protein